jgi:hypothetical protein
LKPPHILAQRLAELRREHRITRMRCPTCGCNPDARCLLELEDDAGLGWCASAGDVPGLATCSACVTPHLRVNPRLWNMPDEETIAELVRLGLAVPRVSTRVAQQIAEISIPHGRAASVRP